MKSYRDKRGSARIIIALTACTASLTSIASGQPSCSVDAVSIRPGESKRLLICGDAITPRARITGLAGRNIELGYRQFLRRCNVDDRRPGVYLLLTASQAARATQLAVVDGESGTALCPEIPVAVVGEPIPVAVPPPWTGAMPESAARFLDVGGIRTRYFVKGDGPPLLLVHGGQPSSADASAWDWQQNFDGLATHFRVYALDRLGQAYTDNPPDLDDYRDYYQRVVEHVYGFIEAAGIDRVHLVGHSQGGWPVTRIALDHPDRVASLVLVDSTMVAEVRDAAQAVRFYLYLSQQVHPPEGATFESMRRLMQMFTYTGNNITDQRVRRSLEISRQPKFREAQAWFEKSGMSPAHPAFRELKERTWNELQAGRLAVPTLIVWGLEDPEGSFESGLKMFAALGRAGANVQFHGFANAGHVPFVEYPEAFNALLVSFCRDTRNDEADDQ